MLQDLKGIFPKNYHCAIGLIMLNFLLKWLAVISISYYVWTQKDTLLPIGLVSMVSGALIQLSYRFREILQQRTSTLFFKRIEKPCEYFLLSCLIISLLKSIFF